MIELSRHFVCAADEVWRLQRGSEADCVLFQKMVNGGERITDRGSRQGTWIFSPGGRVLGRVNSRDVAKVRATLESALEAWEEVPPAERRLPADVELASAHRWESNHPADGLVLERVARELGPEGLEGEPLPGWNRDFAWFTREEARAFVPRSPAPGAEIELPLLARRLARFHLVDNARGQTLPYADPEIREAHITARVVRADGETIELVLEGRTSAVAEGPWLLGDNLWKPKQELARGIETELLGRAVFDRGREAFASFELVGVARRWGRTTMNGRGRDASPGRLAFHFTLASPSERIAPTFVALYDADWIVPPARPTWVESPAECGLEAR